MSLFNSILPSRIRLGSASQHELPLYNSPPGSPEAFPPPPVASSIYASSPSRERANRAVQKAPAVPKSEDRILLQRREKQLELELQELLDAQSDALMSGVAGGNAPSADDVMSINSGTPRIQSPIRRPDLHSQRTRMTPAVARRGIYKSIRELAAVKSHEEDITRREKRECTALQRHLENWDRKRNGLRKEIDAIQHQDIRIRTDALQSEADKLQEEITQAEQKLARMRQRHRDLLSEISQIDNSVQSKMTSYVTSLNMLEDDIQKYLAKPPFPIASSKKDRTFLNLPANRRTLEMAHEYISTQCSSLVRHTKSVREQRQALDAGSILWKKCIGKIEQFERHLKKEMSLLNAENSENNIRVLLGHMNEVITSVESDIAEAEREKWNLLIACIGAELEAFKQGRSILEQAAGVVRENDEQDLIDHHDSPPDPNDDEEDLSAWPGVEEAEQTWQAEAEHEANWPEAQAEEEEESKTVWNTPRTSRMSPIPNADDDEDDDGPHPDLLVSRRPRQDSNSTN